MTRFVSLHQMLIFQYILLIFYRCKFKYVAYIILHQKKKWKFFVLEFLLTSCNAHFHKFYFTFPCITLLIEHSPNSQRPAKAIFSLRLYKSILSDLQFQKTMSRLCFFSIDFISSSLYLPSLSIRLFLPFALHLPVPNASPSLSHHQPYFFQAYFLLFPDHMPHLTKLNSLSL